MTGITVIDGIITIPTEPIKRTGGWVCALPARCGAA
jgi:hypothetical protein